jgi:RHS repeat-associated protein
VDVFLPFGQEWNPQITMNTYKFTGDEHDSESNLEHTQFRQLSSVEGRWLSPDPYMGSMDLTNPQSLNRYAYVNNNPLVATDPSGLDLDETPDNCGPAYGNCDGGGSIGSYGGAGIGGGASVAACGVDPFCISKGGIGPFGSPVATPGGSWNNATYLTGGNFLLRIPTENLTLNCYGAGASFDDCWWAKYSQAYVFNGDETHFYSDEARARYIFEQSYRMAAGPVYGAAAGTAVVAGSGAAGIVSLEGGFDALSENVRIDGPSPGFKYSNGRVFGVRWGPQTLFRMDYQQMRGNAPGPQLHIHILPLGNGEGLRIPLWFPKR